MATATANNNGTKVNPTASDPWSMTVGGGGGGGDYVACPQGNFPAILVALVDIGHQEEKDMNSGTMVEKRKLVLAYELAKKKPDGSPFVLAQRLTWSMHEKATFYKLVTNITGAKFKEGEKFNPQSLMGLPVMVNVTNTTNGDKVYDNVGNVSQFPEGFPVPTSTRKAFSWSVLSGEPLPSGLEWLPRIYGKTLAELVNASAEVKNKGNVTVSSEPLADSDLPF